MTKVTTMKDSLIPARQNRQMTEVSQWLEAILVVVVAAAAAPGDAVGRHGPDSPFPSSDRNRSTG